MSDKTKCPICGKSKKPWFNFCFDCSTKENQKPTCEICGLEVPEGHTLCKKHWQEKQLEKKKLSQINFVKSKKEQDFKSKFEGKYYFNSQKVKSKSELLICYFLEANQIQFNYEPPMTPNGKELRPDFVLYDKKGNYVILEHFGLDYHKYVQNKQEKIRDYDELCIKEKDYNFIYTTEDDIYNLKEKLGKKLNTTPLKRAFWK